MPFNLIKPIIYLITSGKTTPQTTPQSKDFSRLLRVVEASVAAKIDLLQLREKQLTTKTLFQLATRASEIARGNQTHILVNERADVAMAAGASGVHLTSRSIEASLIRKTFGAGLLIGVSTHLLSEIDAARAGAADFSVFGPIFETPSKAAYGQAQGVQILAEATSRAGSFPVLALGGLSLENLSGCFRAGASGVAAIRMFENLDQLPKVVQSIRDRFSDMENEQST